MTSRDRVKRFLKGLPGDLLETHIQAMLEAYCDNREL